MLRFYADKFMAALNTLANTENITNNDPAYIYGDESRRVFLCDTLKALQEQLQTLGLTISAKQCRKLVGAIEGKVGGNNHGMVASYVKQNIDTIRETVQMELEERALYVVLSNTEYLDDASQPFGQLVSDKFPGASFDIAEAGKCLALRRYTACAFHLMRVIEIGIHRLAISLGTAVNPKSGWLTILNDDLEPAINALPQTTPKEQNSKKEMQQARAHLHAVRLGWRNDTMHPKDTYTEDEADALMRHVRTFMIHLAGHLPDASEEPAS